MSRRSGAKPDFYTLDMHYVYILESEDGRHWYVGITNNVERRIAEHNIGKSVHTSKYADWKCKTYIAFEDKQRAMDFEKYLKSHSGRAFTKKRL